MPQHLRARLLSFNDYPSANANAMDYEEDGIVSIDGGLITAVNSADQFVASGGNLADCEDLRPHLLMPGFIDAHIHFPQQHIVASYGTQLLDWLERYAFPAELSYQDESFAQAQAEVFKQSLFSVGTTTALVFTTVHAGSCEALFAAAEKDQMRLLAGKVLMDRNAPAGLTDGDDAGYHDSAQLIERWHGKGRLAYAVTPRFALTSTEHQMAQTQALLKRYPDVYLQSHISENKHEVSETLRAFPGASDYLNVYEQYDLLTNKSLYAHGIYLSDDEIERMQQQQSRVVFCPTSNLFLGSGLLNIERFDPSHNTLAVGSDVGGGTSFSMLTTLSEGYKVCQLNGVSWPAAQALYSITLGNARALSLDNHIGRLAPGYEADMVLLNGARRRLLKQRLMYTNSLEEELFALMMLGDEQIIERTMIAGNTVYQQEPLHG